MYGYVLLILLLAAGAWVASDFLNFRRSNAGEKVKGLECDAGGIVFVEGTKTYYRMPDGSRRKLADYAFDLTPGSKDMNMLTGILEQARKAKQEEASVDRKAAIKNMQDVAKHVNS